MKEIKSGLERKFQILTKDTAQIVKQKYIDSDFNVVGIKKAGNAVTFEEYKTSFESKGFIVYVSDEYRSVK
jgi:hypothetical protein